MIKALVKNGVVVPCDPLPADWQEGTEVEVEKAADNGVREARIHPTDAWMDEVEHCAALQNPQDDMRLHQGIDEERRAAKELARLRNR